MTAFVLRHSARRLFSEQVSCQGDENFFPAEIMAKVIFADEFVVLEFEGLVCYPLLAFFKESIKYRPSGNTGVNSPLSENLVVQNSNPAASGTKKQPIELRYMKKSFLMEPT